MDEQIRSALTVLLAAGPEGKAKQEVIDELTANLLERYQDLVTQGMSEDAAYQAAMDGVGDVGEILALLGANANQGKEAADSATFHGLEDKLRNLARDLEGPVRSAVGGVRSAAHAAKGPLKEMGRAVADAVRNVEITVTVKDEHRFDYTVPGLGITGLDIHLRSGDLQFKASENDDIFVVERSSRPLSEDKHVTFFRREDGVLCINQSNTATGFLIFGFGFVSSNLEIYLPRRLFTTLSATTISGDITFHTPLHCQTLSLSSTNGDISGRDLVCATLHANTVSGDVDLEAQGDEVILLTTSGDMTFEGAPRRVVCESVSGDVDLTLLAMPSAIELTSVSGDLETALPENDGFSVQYQTVSGDLKSDYPLMTPLNHRAGVALYGESQQRPPYRFTTVSGDMHVARL